MQNNHLGDFRFYEGITEENIRREKKELEKKGHEVFNLEIDELTNQFILFYNKRDITKPPEADLMKPTLQSATYEPEPKDMLGRIVDFGKQYWILSSSVAVGLFYYFVIYKGGKT